MRMLLAFIFSIICFTGKSQDVKTGDLKTLYDNTMAALRNNDTLAFIKLWERPESILNACGDDVYNIFHEDAMKRHFIEISTSWGPYLHRLTYQKAELEKEVQLPDGEDYGRGFCFRTLLDNKKNKPVSICSDVKYVKGKLVFPQGALLSPLQIP